jgi:hypothetical protein
MQRFTITFAVALFVGLVTPNTGATTASTAAPASAGYAGYAAAY